MTKPAISLGGAVLQVLRPLVGSSQLVALSAVTAASSAVPAKVNVARLVAPNGARYRVTPSASVPGTAVAADTILSADAIEFVEVAPGDTIDALELAAATGGNLNVTWMV